MNSEKTNGKWILYLLLIVAVVLAWYPTFQDWLVKDQPVGQEVTQPVKSTMENLVHEPPDPIDMTYTAKSNSRTWEVFKGGGHLELKDKFKLMKVKDEYRLRPLYRLRDNWGFRDSSDYSMPLTKLKISEVKGKTLTIFCGLADFKTAAHPGSDNSSSEKHAVFIIPQKHDDILEVRFFDNPNGEDCKTVWDNQGSIIDHHGGVAHVEN